LDANCPSGSQCGKYSMCSDVISGTSDTLLEMIRSFVRTSTPEGINWYDYNRDWRYTNAAGSNFHQLIKDSFAMVSEYNPQGEAQERSLF
jgi:hypothetical protein